MKNIRFFNLFLLAALIFIPYLNAQETRPWFQNGPRTPKQTNTKLKMLPLIKVQGNKFIDPEGKTVLFRGIAISDPDKVERQGHRNKAHFREEPICAVNIGYVTHPYPFKRSQPYPPKWEEDFGFAASQYPVFATEFGDDVRTGTIDPEGDHYSNQIIGYLESKGISWTIWVFDPEWGGAKIKSWNYELTPGGEFYKLAMQGKLKVQTNK
jgi:hypothetical protein